MNKFIANLKAQAEDNPVVAIGLATATVATATKLVETFSSVRSKNAYAKKMNHSMKKSRK